MAETKAASLTGGEGGRGGKGRVGEGTWKAVARVFALVGQDTVVFRDGKLICVDDRSVQTLVDRWHDFDEILEHPRALVWKEIRGE